MKIENPKLKHFNSYPEEIQTYMRYVYGFCKPENKYKKNKGLEIRTLSFNAVAMLIQDFSAPTEKNIVEAFYTVFKINKKTLYNLRMSQFFPLYNYILAQLETIISAEKRLHSSPDADMLAANVEVFKKYGVGNVLDDLALRYHTHPNVVKEWEYGYCYFLLSKMKDEREFNKRYAKIIEQKNK